MSILLTGGNGKTTSQISHLLYRASIPFLIASRQGTPSTPISGLEQASYVEFDFTKPSTFENPFKHKLVTECPISVVYLVDAHVPNGVEAMNGFIDYARDKHAVKKFVLLGASTAEKGSEVGVIGKVWEHLNQTGAEFALLGPTWFMDNYLDAHEDHLRSINQESRICTASGEAGMAFVSAADIAAAAVAFLTSEKPLDGKKHNLFGPGVLTLQEVAFLIGQAVNRRIEVVYMSAEEREAYLLERGFPEGWAKFLTTIESRVKSHGALDGYPDDAFRRLVGREPQTFASWVEENKLAWM